MRKLIEPIGLTLFILIVFKIGQLFLPPTWVAVIVPGTLLYAPFMIFIYYKRQIDFLDRSWGQFGKGIKAFLIWTLLIFPPYLIGAHFWMLHVFGFEGFNPASWQTFTNNFFFQVLVVALPEEFFFRGYLQSTLRKIFAPRWKVFGVKLGWGWVLTAFIFAFAHSVIQLQWWHFSIFFPALLFGYLKEKTGSITAPILFHAFSNLFMQWFQRSYF